MNEQNEDRTPSGAVVGAKVLTPQEIEVAMMINDAAPAESRTMANFDPVVVGIISNVALRRQRAAARLVIHSEKDPEGAAFLTPAQWLLVSTHNQVPPDLESFRKMVLAMAGLYAERLNYPDADELVQCAYRMLLCERRDLAPYVLLVQA